MPIRPKRSNSGPSSLRLAPSSSAARAVDAAFIKKLSAYENLMYAARLYVVRPRQAKADADGRLCEILLGFIPWGILS